MAFKIAQISDIHCGDLRFDGTVLEKFIAKINKYSPDLVVIAGDLTANGYHDEFDEAKKYIDSIGCKNKIIIAGNHDCRNVGYEYFEKIFGQRYTEKLFPAKKIKGNSHDIRIMAVDSNRPDLDDGEVGRDKYKYIDRFFKNRKKDFSILILHHHLVSIPGTGRERNVVYDAGDLLAKISKLNIDMVLSGHKHVPFIWRLNDVKLITSGTGGTQRTRADNPPAVNFIEIADKKTRVAICSDEGIKRTTDFKR